MSKSRLRHIAIALLWILVFFYAGNNLFIHTHLNLCGSRVVHSHPYLPGQSHGHSAQSLESIALANSAFLGIEKPGVACVAEPQCVYITLEESREAVVSDIILLVRQGRAPPAFG